MNDPSEIKLRKSEASEVDLAIPLIYSSGPDAFEFVFKNNQVSAQDFLRYAFVRPGGEFSYDNHYSLYHNRVMIGIGSFFEAKRASSFTRYDAMNIIRFYKHRSIPIVMNGLGVENIIKLPKAGETALAHLSITPALRGIGLGSILIEKLMDRGPSGTTRYILDVSEKNPRAKILYERLGFVTTGKLHSTLKNSFSHVPNHYRMEFKQ